MNKEVETKVEEEDPYGYMLDECRISSSQELYLENCPFAGESEVFSDDDDDFEKMNKEVEIKVEVKEEDPYGYMLDECRISSSQELYLQTCPFAGESEVFSEDDDDFDLTPYSTNDDTKPERIVMVFPPEKPKDDEVFQTPPEGSKADDSLQEKEPAPARKVEGADDYGYVDMDTIEVSSVVSQKSKEVCLGLGKLPASIGRKVNVKGRKEKGTPVNSKDKSLKALLDTLQMYDGDVESDSEEVDLMEIAEPQVVATGGTGI